MKKDQQALPGALAMTKEQRHLTIKLHHAPDDLDRVPGLENSPVQFDGVLVIPVTLNWPQLGRRNRRNCRHQRPMQIGTATLGTAPDAPTLRGKWWEIAITDEDNHVTHLLIVEGTLFDSEGRSRSLSGPTALVQAPAA